MTRYFVRTVSLVDSAASPTGQGTSLVWDAPIGPIRNAQQANRHTAIASTTPSTQPPTATHQAATKSTIATPDIQVSSIGCLPSKVRLTLPNEPRAAADMTAQARRARRFHSVVSHRVSTAGKPT